MFRQFVTFVGLYTLMMGAFRMLPLPKLNPTISPDSYACFVPPHDLLSVMREGTVIDSLPDSLTTMNLKDLRMLVFDN